MTATLVIITIGSGLVSALLTSQSAAWSRVFKMVASTAVILIVVTGSPTLDGYTLFVAMGLIASWIGDLALSFSGRKAFLAGLIAFALAHVLYTSGFFARSQMNVLAVVLAGVAMGVTAVAILSWLSPHLPEQMSVPVTVYVGIISVMVVASFGTSGTLADPRIPSAAVLFAFSDVLVARQQFVVEDPWNRMIGLPVYYSAQVLFALTIINV